MTVSFLPGLAPAEMKREKIRKRVRPTSRAQYADGRERFKGRRANVLRWLAAYYNAKQVWPTSGELASWANANTEFQAGSWDAMVLYIRRGLSDLQTSGSVETLIKRMCSQISRECCVWRVVPR